MSLFGRRKTVFVDADILVIGGGMAGCGATYESRYWGRDLKIVCGHWSTLGLVNRPDLLGIDTGCVWGGALTAVRVDGGRREVMQVRCEQAQSPLL